MLNYVKYFSLTGDLMDEIGRKALLFDFYGPLLTEKQRQIYDYAVGEDMSLGEIAEATGVSRQAVHDMVRRTAGILESYEEKLGLAQKFIDIEMHLSRIRLLVSEEAAKEHYREIAKEIEAIDLIERK